MSAQSNLKIFIFHDVFYITLCGIMMFPKLKGRKIHISFNFMHLSAIKLHVMEVLLATADDRVIDIFSLRRLLKLCSVGLRV
jgi:hypothetical protein